MIRFTLCINVLQTNEIPGYHHNSGREEQDAVFTGNIQYFIFENAAWCLVTCIS